MHCNLHTPQVLSGLETHAILLDSSYLISKCNCFRFNKVAPTRIYIHVCVCEINAGICDGESSYKLEKI